MSTDVINVPVDHDVFKRAEREAAQRGVNLRDVLIGVVEGYAATSSLTRHGLDIYQDDPHITDIKRNHDGVMIMPDGWDNTEDSVYDNLS